MAQASRRGRGSAPAAPSRIERLLGLAADREPDGDAAARLRPLRRLLLLWGAVRSWVWLAFDAPLDPAALVASAALLSAAAVLAWPTRYEHLAARLALPALLVQAVAGFPLAPNHFFVELYAVALLALAGHAGRDAPLALYALRWLVAIVLFHTGLQKVLYGHYFAGDFLAYMVGRGDRFADLFRLLLPASEVARLQGYELLREGAGPYRVHAPLFVAASNAVWIAELLLPPALIARRTRRVAAWAAFALVLAIQLGARELGFALLFTALLSTFLPAAVARRALPPLGVALLGVLAAATTGIGRGWIEAWHLW